MARDTSRLKNAALPGYRSLETSARAGLLFRRAQVVRAYFMLRFSLRSSTASCRCILLIKRRVISSKRMSRDSRQEAEAHRLT